MKLLDRFKIGIEGLSNAFGRFPLTAVFLIVIAILDGIMIETEDFDFEKYLATLIVGAFLAIVFQMVYERFFTKNSTRLLLMSLTVILALGYYLTIKYVTDLSMEIGVKTAVAIFGLFIAFLWVPSIKSKISFNECFMAGFKSFFISIFFSGVLFSGLSMVYGATNELLFEVNNKIYSHTANIVFVIFSTMYFLSLTPKYLGKKDLGMEEKDMNIIEDEVAKYTFCPKYLEILISYIVIPLSMIFTLILLLYIVKNISGSFWNDALLEPMLIAYIVVVILLYILASRIENQFGKTFRKIFPKVLLPIVLFQTVNSFLKIGEFGLTYGRYYVILFGIFAFVSGLVFSFKPVSKNGIVPMILIIFIVISIVPPVDAFSISKFSQINILENTLMNNGMLYDNKITPKSDIEEIEKKKITETARYIHRMDYFDDIEWIPEDFEFYKDFEDVFGFPSYRASDGYSKGDGEYIYLNIDRNEIIDIEDYDWFIQTNMGYSQQGKKSFIEYDLINNGESYKILSDDINNDIRISLYDTEGYIITSIWGKDIISKFKDSKLQGKTLPLEDAILISENNKGTIKMVIRDIDIYTNTDNSRFNAEIYLFVKIK